MDLTNKTIVARLAKRPGSVRADLSTRTDPVFNFIDFNISILNATAGEYAITLPKETTVKLPEGKMVYSVFLKDENDFTTEVVQGLAFVKPSLGYSDGYGTVSNNYGV